MRLLIFGLDVVRLQCSSNAAPCTDDNDGKKDAAAAADAEEYDFKAESILRGDQAVYILMVEIIHNTNA